MAARARGLDQLDPGLARAGIELFRHLPGTAGRSVLLCTDLHHDNVLAAAREPWLVIDPKPYVGDPAYDLLQQMLNFPDRLAADPAGFADRMAGLLGLDRNGYGTGCSPGACRSLSAKRTCAPQPSASRRDSTSRFLRPAVAAGPIPIRAVP